MQDSRTILHNKLTIPLSLKAFILGMNILLLENILWILQIGIKYIYLFAYLILFFSIYFSLKEKRVRLLKRKYKNWLIATCFFSIFMLIHGIILGNDMKFIINDISPYCFFAGTFVAARDDTWKTLDRMLYWHFCIIVLLVLYAWKAHGLNISYALALYKPDEGKVSLYMAWNLLSIFPYFCLTYNNSSLSRKIVTILGSLLFLFLSVLFVKRAPFLLFIIFVALSFINILAERLRLKINIKNMFKIIFTVLLISILCLLAYNVIETKSTYGFAYKIEILLNRFIGTDNDLSTTFCNDYRLKEGPKTIIQQAEKYQIFVGQGFGATYIRPLLHQGISNFIENGIANIFLKGGIIFMLLWYSVSFYILLDFFNKRQKKKRPFQLLLILFSCMSMVSIAFSIFPGIFTGYIMLWLGRCMTKENVIDYRVPCK